jgi:beta-glucosidase
MTWLNGESSQPTIIIDGLAFRDLDHDGVLAPYEDHRLPTDVRVEDLLGRMTIAEKVGLLMHGTAPAVGPMGSIGVGSGYDLETLQDLIGTAHVNSMISRLSLPAERLAAENNAIQTIAAGTRLGIPVTVSTDPRSHFTTVVGASVAPTGFSQWPETLGLAAIGDSGLVERFADIVRQEYRAVGMHMALSPQADLATAPLWPRTEGTFGEDPALVRAMVGAYVRGIQGGSSGLSSNGVAAIVKHWVGYGASRDGFDGHNYYGRFSAFPGGRFQDHVDAFLDAFAAGVVGVMPTYNILNDVEVDGEPLEQVGAGYSHQLLEGLLRKTHGFRGLVLSDWSITKDMSESCRTGNPPQTPDLIAMPWGVEDLTKSERFAKAMLAGMDQFGGVNDPSSLMEAVERGAVSEARIDQSVRRVLAIKFDLGLFENPFVDSTAASTVVGSAMFAAEATAAQRRSITLLSGPRTALVTETDSVYVAEGSPIALDMTQRGMTITSDLAQATVAVVAVSAPFEILHPNHFFGARQHEGSLEYPTDHPERLAVEAAAQVVPTIVIAHLDRPAVLGPIVDAAHAVLCEFGASPAAVVDVLLGHASPDGQLPFQIPRSMDAVLARPCDAPNADPNPLYALHHRAG